MPKTSHTHSRSFKNWVKRIEGGVLTTSQLMWFGHELNGNHRRSNLTHDERQSLYHKMLAAPKLTVDHESEMKGLRWLYNLGFTKTGNRKKNTPFGEREYAILGNFSHFEVGSFRTISHHGFDVTRPVFKVVDGDGNYFLYIVRNTHSDFMAGLKGEAIEVF